MTHSIISVGSTTLVKVNGLQDSNGSYLNNATVTLESFVERVSGTAVSGLTVPVTLSYVPTSNGNYQTELDETIGIVDGGQYIATLKAVAATGQVKLWTEHVRGRYSRA